MKKKSVILGIILSVIVGGIWVGLSREKPLEGVHFMTNFMNDGVYEFYVDAEKTEPYGYRVDWLLEDVAYEVWRLEQGTEVLVEQDQFGFTVEAYYPFMDMDLEAGYKYKVIMRLQSEDTAIGLAQITRLAND